MQSVSIKTKVVLVVATCLALGAVALVGFVSKSYQDNINLIAKQSLSAAERSYQSLEENDVRMLSATLESLLTNDQIRQKFLAGDRDQLLNYVNPLYTDMKKRYGITHWLFINTEATHTVFLRLQKPEQFGDELKRTTYLNSIATKDFASGKDLGKNGFALRVVHPYYDANGKLIGYMELGEKIDRFLATMKKQTGDDYGLLVDKKFLSEKDYVLGLQSAGKRNNWNDQKDVVILDKTTRDDKIVRYSGKLDAIPAEGKFLEQIKDGDRMLIRGIFPLYDAAKKQVGGVFVVRDITPIYKGMQAVKTSAITAIVVLMLIISGTILSILNKLIFARLAKTIEVVTQVVGGEFETQIVPESDDEVGKLETLMEQFRAVFVNTVQEMDKQKKSDKAA